jgi:hypothetical protein
LGIGMPKILAVFFYDVHLAKVRKDERIKNRIVEVYIN